MDHPNPQATHEAIKQALFAGQKIFAIKLYREQNHVGLAEAKAAVEKLEAELGITAMHHPNPPATPEAITEALFAGKKIFAIKLYREQNHVGLAEAKAAVEKLEEELGIAAVRRATHPPAAGYFVLLVLIVAIGVVVWKVLASSHGHASP